MLSADAVTACVRVCAGAAVGHVPAVGGMRCDAGAAAQLLALDLTGVTLRGCTLPQASGFPQLSVSVTWVCVPSGVRC